MSYEPTNRLAEAEAGTSPANEHTRLIRQVAGDAYSRMVHVERDMEDCIRRNPVSSALIAAGCGALIGGAVMALLRSTTSSNACSRAWSRWK